MSGIFISYRREDSGGYAQRLYESLRVSFGNSQVFMDIDSIEAGADFARVIRERLAQCDACIVLVGRNWLRVTDEKGRRRLDDPGDFVRQELHLALTQGIFLVPVLVGGAAMPRADELPLDIRPFSSRNGYEIPDHFYKQSVRHLIQVLETSSPRLKWAHARTRRTILVAAGGACVIMAGGVVLNAILRDKPQPSPARTPPVADAPALDVPDAPRVPGVIVREPPKVTQAPAPVEGSWTIDKVFPEAAGPTKAPHFLWSARVLNGSRTRLVGFAPDETIFLWQGDTISGIRDRVEAWAFKAVGWNLAGITPDGRIWLTGEPWLWNQSKDEGKGVYCFNSRGEGGLIAGLHVLPRNVLAIPDPYPSYPEDTCHGGTLQLSRRRAVIPLDGNCDWAFRGADGRVYAATDRRTLYCFDPNGIELWKYAAETEVHSPPLLVLNDPVFAGEESLFSLHDGKRRWRCELNRCELSFADQLGRTYLSYKRANGESAIGAVDHEGHLLWSLKSPYVPIALDPVGRLYLVNEDEHRIVCATA